MKKARMRYNMPRLRNRFGDIELGARCAIGEPKGHTCRSISTQQNILLGTTPFYPATSVAGYGDVVPSNSNAAARAAAALVHKPPQQKL